MLKGAEVARALLIQVRNERVAFPVLAGMLEAALPENNPERLAFLLIVAEYLATALEGAATDPEYLGLGVSESSA